jgi:ectoine hydroxylase-related dioxygenase (phytanoyl-CoA dioxygenase family)
MSASSVRARTWLSKADCDLAEFRQAVERVTDSRDYQHAERIERNVPVYRARETAGAERGDLHAELTEALLSGPGVVVFEGAFDAGVLDRASAVFHSLIEAQQQLGTSTGDHFADAGSNDRLWGALEKLALTDPETFVDYYANDVLALVSTAWLGPNYQIVSEPNVVNPGSGAQVGHRDYHLGLMEIEYAVQFPAHVHRLSPALTLQAGIAHVDMPTETGPTIYLPYSQTYEPGYLAGNLPEFQEYFEQHYVQLPLRKGDVLFFNPAVMHAAGANTSSGVKRTMNLLQISSAFGRAAATVNTECIVRAIYPVLRARRKAGVAASYLDNVIAAGAEGYPFPTNLDRDRPLGALFPESQARLVHRALENDWAEAQLHDELALQTHRRRSNLDRETPVE